MNTKILSSPFPDDDESDVKQTQQQGFDLASRKVSVNWDVDTLIQASDTEQISRGARATLGLYIVSQKIELVVDLMEINFIGRSYPQGGHFHGIDFSSFGAYKKGISRLHVILKQEGNDLLIIDNNSTNGTYLNRAMLQAMQPYVLYHNDNVRLGAFEFVIKLD